MNHNSCTHFMESHRQVFHIKSLVIPCMASYPTYLTYLGLYIAFPKLNFSKRSQNAYYAYTYIFIIHPAQCFYKNFLIDSKNHTQPWVTIRTSDINGESCLDPTDRLEKLVASFSLVLCEAILLHRVTAAAALSPDEKPLKAI